MFKSRGHAAIFLALCALFTSAGVGASTAAGAAKIGGEGSSARAEAENPRASAGSPHGGPVSEGGVTATESSSAGGSKGSEASTTEAVGTGSGSGSASHGDASSPGTHGSSGGRTTSGLSGTASESGTAATGQSAAAQAPSSTGSSTASPAAATGSTTGTPSSGGTHSTTGSTAGGPSAAGGLSGGSGRTAHGNGGGSTHRGSGGGSGGTASRSLPGTSLNGSVSAATTAGSPVGAILPGSPAARGSQPPRPIGHPHRSQGIEPAIHTVERIAGVVPESIWLMMAVLAVLSAMLGIRSWLISTGARRLERQRRLLAEEVGTLQAALLPAIPERLGPVRTSVAYRPAEGPAAGGDFYDVFALTDGRLAVIMGDVSGHGPTALPQTALLRYTLRTHLDSGLSPRAALSTSASMLDHQLEGSFATAVLAVLDPESRTLTYACAGHPTPMVVAGEPLEPNYAGASPPIGAGLPTGMRQTVVSLPGPAEICFFTDGVVEARADGELLGADRLREALAALGAQASASDLLERVARETDARPDDMAACLLQIDAPAVTPNGVAGEPSILCEEMELDQRELAGERGERFLLACGLSPARTSEALDAARVVVGCDGTAVLRVLSANTVNNGELPEVEVVPGGARVMHMHDLRNGVADLHPATSG